jgi:hypothetical protein
MLVDAGTMAMQFVNLEVSVGILMSQPRVVQKYHAKRNAAKGKDCCTV